MISDDSDDEDDAAALMAELAKIKREREEEKARLVCFRHLPSCTPIALVHLAVTGKAL